MRPSHGPADPLARGFRSLPTPCVADALARLGLPTALPGLAALGSPGARAVGIAATLRLSPSSGVGSGAASGAGADPVEAALAAVAAAPPGSFLLVQAGAGASDPPAAAFGGVPAFTASRRGLVGCAVDGATRDVDEMRAVHFPIWARGVVPTSPRGHWEGATHGESVELAGVTCAPGDVVVADANGVVVVPRARAAEALELAHQFLALEERVKDAIEGGADPVRAEAEARGAAPLPGTPSPRP